MKTVTLYVGDLLRVLVDEPLSAGLHKGDLVRVLRFKPDGTPIVSGALNRPSPYAHLTWFCDLTKLFKHYKKETK